MKARLVPVFFDPGRDEEFDQQIRCLAELLADEAELLAPVALGSPLPEAEAVVFPQLLGAAYRQLAAFKQISLPILIITSEFGTVSMWDWEIASYLRTEGVETIAPYNLDQARAVCRALVVKRELAQSRFLVFQDNPGAGFQASIFKRFYWWEDECTQRMHDRFGVTVVKKSFRELAAAAKEVSDQEARQAEAQWRQRAQGVSERAFSSAVKLYVALKRELEQDSGIKAVGINCLNESHFSDTTPCLALSMLYEEMGLTWGCEADTMSMLSQYILHEALRAPVMMSNLYPFIMGQAALKHEHIPEFPQAEAPEDCILVVHCGYFGLMPPSFATEWALKPKVLAIVDDNATAVDARLPVGDVTMAKLGARLDTMTVVEGKLEGYAQYPGSHCLNGGVIRVPNGPALVSKLPSHHYLVLTGKHRVDIDQIAGVFGLRIQGL